AMVRHYFGVGAQDSHEVATAKARRALQGLDEQPEELAEKLGVFFHGAKGLNAETADDLKRETFEAMGRLVADLCRRQPLLMVFEDLHWIDDLSREMLELAVAKLYSFPIMVLVTHRPDYEPHWRASVALTELHLRPLSEAAAAELVRAVACGDVP